jgi:negative regulator of replication initiation
MPASERASPFLCILEPVIPASVPGSPFYAILDLSSWRHEVPIGSIMSRMNIDNRPHTILIAFD